MTDTPESKQQPIDWLDYKFKMIRSNPEVEARLLAAYTHASVHSPDPSTQLGAILFCKRGEKEFSVVGENAPSRGLVFTPEQFLNRELKLLCTCHAEEKAILSAASIGLPTKGSTLVVPWYACPECAKAIVAANVKEVVGHLQMFQKTPERWRNPIVAGLRILQAGGVVMSLYDGPVGESGDDGVSVRFNGERFSPGEGSLEIVYKA